MPGADVVLHPGAVISYTVVTSTTLTWNGTIAPGARLTLGYQVAVLNTGASGTLINRVVASGETPSGAAVLSTCSLGTETNCYTLHAFAPAAVIATPGAETPPAHDAGVPNTGIQAMMGIAWVFGTVVIGALVGLGVFVKVRRSSDAE